MGDFERNAKQAEGAESKKLVMVGVLASVLVGVVALQMMKGGPSTAGAASVTPAGGNDSGQAAQSGNESADALRDALLKDPTPSLLAGSRSPTVAPSERNPFAMARAWRMSLTPQDPIPEPAPVQPVQPDLVGPAPTPVPQPLELKVGEYKLNMIMVSNGQLTALINNSPVSAGSRIRDAVVVDVRSDTVVLRHKDFPQGRQLELTLKPN